MKKTMLWCVLSMLLAASAAHAVTYKSYSAAKVAGGVQWDYMKIYFSGAGTAYMYSNIRLIDEKRSPLYCPPPHLALAAENYIDILDQQLALSSIPFKDDQQIDVVLLLGLERTFPCKP